ncbi:MAG: S9 family peptidase, partial [Actinomycetota bacterium]|nr:S9 family peptidase [Actinomycetota bacterium]
MAKPFTVDALLSMPRVDALAVSSDGSRLVTSVARPDADGKRFATSWWELDPTGQRPPRRLTRSAPGPTAAAFLPDGSLLFLSARDEPDAAGDGPTDQAAALWLL